MAGGEPLLGQRQQQTRSYAEVFIPRLIPGPRDSATGQSGCCIFLIGMTIIV